jgi:TonB-linked SusC/RagA family outer membrane protein
MRTWIVRATIAGALAWVGATAVSAQQTGTVTGTVVDRSTMQPLQGAQVNIPGSSVGQLANAQGRFLLLNVPTGEVTVRVQIIGYGSEERLVTVTPGTAAVADFQLQAQAVELGELVVIGYGQQRREDITGAVAKVDAADFVQTPAVDAASLVSGKIAGLVVNTTTGDPTEGTEINLRGIGTLQASAQPLIIVDGVPGDLETVAPQDIASIDILKDASAAAVYGSRAANGVVFITTKKYEGGEATIRYDGYTSVQTLYKQMDFLKTADVRRLAAEGFSTPAGNTFEDLGYGTDWQDMVMRDNPIAYNHNVTLMGGSGATNYTAALTYEYTEGLFQKSDNKEITGRVNIGHSMYDGKLKADLNLVNRIQNEFTGVNFDYMWRQASIRNPTDRVYQDDGTWQTRGAYFYTNPVQMLETYGGDAETRDLRLHGTLTFRPIPEFSLAILGGTERDEWIRGRYRTLDNPDVPGINWADRDASSNISQLLNITGTYQNTFGGHQITALGGYEYWDRVHDEFGADNERFPTDLFQYSNLGTGSGLPEGLADLASGKWSYKTIGFFGRVNWDWNNRFLAMASLRYEGDSRFGADHQWGVFPGVQVGWRLSEESFLQDVDAINDLKVRAGFGVTGIAPRDAYLSLTTYEYDDNYPVGGSWVQELVPGQNPNPDLRWEKKEELDVGVDFSLFDYRLAGTLDYYRRDTRDMLYNYDVPVPPFLYGSILANVGHMRNTGVEASLTYDVVRRGDLRWRTSANWSTNSNELLRLSNDVYEAAECFYPGHTGEPIQIDTHRLCVGGPLGDFYGFESVDITPEGEWIVLDSAGVNQIPYSEAGSNDRRVLGNGIPKHYVAWNNAVQWKNFDLNVNMRGAFGFQILNFGRLYYENLNNTQYNMLQSAFDPVYGKAILDYPLVYVSYYIEDGDYWKIDNATLGYTLDQSVLPGFLGNVAQSARIYVAGRNLLTLTGYKGLDPETRTTDLDNIGVDHRDQYPTTRTFTIGMNLVF